MLLKRLTSGLWTEITGSSSQNGGNVSLGRLLEHKPGSLAQSRIDLVGVGSILRGSFHPGINRNRKTLVTWDELNDKENLPDDAKDVFS